MKRTNLIQNENLSQVTGTSSMSLRQAGRKAKVMMMIIVMGLLLSGCFIKSLYPFYTKKDIVYDTRIIGTWLDNDSSKWVIKQLIRWPIKPDSAYQVEIVDKDGKPGSFSAHLFRLNNQLYFDFYPNGKIGSNDLIDASIVLSHSLAKITYTGTHIKMQWFNEVWFEQLLNQNKIRIKNEKVEGGYLLTASTAELQKFIIKYGNDPQAFKTDWGKNQKDKDQEALTFDLKKISNEAN